MHTTHRPSRRDWITAVAAGAALGFVFLGVAARAGMRLIALDIGQAPTFTVEGSIAVSLLGALTGALVGVIFMLVRTALPTRRWLRAAIFWTVCLALALRGLRPLSVLNASIFVPLFVLHGALLHTYWCRIHLARGRRVDAGV
jgi:hypothetical protein